MKISMVIIAVLLTMCTIMVSAWSSTYMVLKQEERDYAYLENRYAELYSQNMATELMNMDLPKELWEE